MSVCWMFAVMDYINLLTDFHPDQKLMEMYGFL